MDTRPIGVFDSGVGGLSILKELEKILPNEDFVFVADQKNLPYGEKNKKELLSLTKKVTNFLVENHNIKMLVIACNTATTYTVDDLRKEYSFPIVRTVPAIKPASEKSKSKVVSIISTSATSKSPVLKKLIKDFAKGVKVINIGCKGLVSLVENGEVEGEQTEKTLLKYLLPLKDSGADYLVLGCTHYPFLSSAIKKILGSKIKLIDSGEAIGRQAKFLIKQNKISNIKHKRKTLYFTTGNKEAFSVVASGLMQKKVQGNFIKV